MVRPTKLFWKASKYVIRYLRGTTQFGLWYKWIEGVKLYGLTNADWARSPLDMEFSVLGLQMFPSTEGSKYLWCLAQKKKNTSLQVKKHVTWSRWERYFLDYLVRWWIQVWSIVLIIVASSSLRIFFSRLIQVYRYLVSSFTRLCEEVDNVATIHFDRGTRCWHFDKGIFKREVRVPRM